MPFDGTGAPGFESLGRERDCFRRRFRRPEGPASGTGKEWFRSRVDPPGCGESRRCPSRCGEPQPGRGAMPMPQAPGPGPPDTARGQDGSWGFHHPDPGNRGTCRRKESRDRGRLRYPTAGERPDRTVSRPGRTTRTRPATQSGAATGIAGIPGAWSDRRVCRSLSRSARPQAECPALPSRGVRRPREGLNILPRKSVKMQPISAAGGVSV